MEKRRVKSTPKAKKTSKSKKIVIASLVVAFAGLLLIIFNFYNLFYKPNIVLKSKGDSYLRIPTGASFYDVLNILQKEGLLINRTSFEWVANRFDYPNNVRAGRYLITDQMNNKDLIILLKSGRQTPVKLVINSIRTKQQLISRLSKELEPDSVWLSNYLSSNDSLDGSGFTKDNVMAMFIPDTYEIYWSISAKDFVLKMSHYYHTFWNEQRELKAKQIPLTPVQVITLASIIEQETKKKDEQPIVAGVYINRLKKGLKLEADPTLVYALGDFSIRRVLNIHKEIDSPYNTYKYQGLPPGPICMPAMSSIDAVLNYKKHDYLYFCAREDFSGYHNFASNYPQHMLNALKYRRQLDKRNIKK